jgi:DNA-binding CsgD family transcriptional regulator/tetratricopeptide (TPR) repeat protein
MPTPNTRETSPGALSNRMRAALSEGRLSAAAQMFDQEEKGRSSEAALFRARIYLKKRKFGDAIEFLNHLSDGKLSRAQSAEALMLLGVAHSRATRFAEADEYFERATSHGQQLVASGELQYWQGRRFLEEHRPLDALVQLELVRKSAGDEARIYHDLLESGILTQQRRYLDGALVLMHLLEFMDGVKTDHREEEIWALHTLAGLARELDAPRIRRFVQARVNRQEWTDDFRVNQFQTYKAVAWCHALEGDYFNCFRYLKLAGAIAPSPSWRAMTLLDRAYLARCVGEPLSSRAELAEAQEILDMVSWRDTDDEERVALPLAAELSAALDSGRAASYLAKFFELRDALSPQLHMRYDERLSALSEYADGVVQAQLGNRKSASTAFRKAWSVYNEIGYDWRAGRCALRLYDLTRDAQWQERAVEKLRNYTGSWLHDELRGRRDIDLPPVTPAQRRVLDLLVAGKTTEQIARATGTRPYTIQNHIKAMLRAFSVPSRSVLIAEAMKRGLGGPKAS